jgi:hypothetical protein
MKFEIHKSNLIKREIRLEKSMASSAAQPCLMNVTESKLLLIHSTTLSTTRAAIARNDRTSIFLLVTSSAKPKARLPLLELIC